MISKNVSPAAIAVFSKIYFPQNGISCFSHCRCWEESLNVKDICCAWGGWGLLGAPISSLSRGPGSSRVQDGQPATFTLEVLALDVLVQTSTDSGFLVLVKCDRVFVLLLLFIYSFIFGLDWGFHFRTVSCFKNLQSKEKRCWSWWPLAKFALLSLPGIPHFSRRCFSAFHCFEKCVS